MDKPTKLIKTKKQSQQKRIPATDAPAAGRLRRDRSSHLGWSDGDVRVFSGETGVYLDAAPATKKKRNANS